MSTLLSTLKSVAWVLVGGDVSDIEGGSSAKLLPLLRTGLFISAFAVVTDVVTEMVKHKLRMKALTEVVRRPKSFYELAGTLTPMRAKGEGRRRTALYRAGSLGHILSRPDAMSALTTALQNDSVCVVITSRRNTGTSTLLRNYASNHTGVVYASLEGCVTIQDVTEAMIGVLGISSVNFRLPSWMVAVRRLVRGDTEESEDSWKEVTMWLEAGAAEVRSEEVTPGANAQPHKCSSPSPSAERSSHLPVLIFDHVSSLNLDAIHQLQSFAYRCISCRTANVCFASDRSVTISHTLLTSRMYALTLPLPSRSSVITYLHQRLHEADLGFEFSLDDAATTISTLTGSSLGMVDMAAMIIEMYARTRSPWSPPGTAKGALEEAERALLEREFADASAWDLCTTHPVTGGRFLMGRDIGPTRVRKEDDAKPDAPEEEDFKAADEVRYHIYTVLFTLVALDEWHCSRQLSNETLGAASDMGLSCQTTEFIEGSNAPSPSTTDMGSTYTGYYQLQPSSDGEEPLSISFADLWELMPYYAAKRVLHDDTIAGTLPFICAFDRVYLRTPLVRLYVYWVLLGGSLYNQYRDHSRVCPSCRDALLLNCFRSVLEGVNMSCTPGLGGDCARRRLAASVQGGRQPAGGDPHSAEQPRLDIGYRGGIL